MSVSQWPFSAIFYIGVFAFRYTHITGTIYCCHRLTRINTFILPVVFIESLIKQFRDVDFVCLESVERLVCQCVAGASCRPLIRSQPRDKIKVSTPSSASLSHLQPHYSLKFGCSVARLHDGSGNQIFYFHHA